MKKKKYKKRYPKKRKILVDRKTTETCIWYEQNLKKNLYWLEEKL